MQGQSFGRVRHPHRAELQFPVMTENKMLQMSLQRFFQAGLGQMRGEHFDAQFQMTQQTPLIRVVIGNAAGKLADFPEIVKERPASRV